MGGRGRRGCRDRVLSLNVLAPAAPAARGPVLRAGLGPSLLPGLLSPPPRPPPPSLPGPLLLAASVAFCFCVFAGRSPSCSVETMVLTLGESWPVLVGKRFLSLSAADGGDGGHDSWDVERVAEWPWLSGTIRAVSHTDVTKKDLKV